MLLFLRKCSFNKKGYKYYGRLKNIHLWIYGEAFLNHNTEKGFLLNLLFSMRKVLFLQGFFKQ